MGTLCDLGSLSVLVLQAVLLEFLRLWRLQRLSSPLHLQRLLYARLHPHHRPNSLPLRTALRL